MTSDENFMRHAIRLGGRMLGRVAPNPAVGCVIVKNGAIVGRGWTQEGGRPHAETMALQQAGEEARGATAYVSLEPCAHHGQTPPCAESLIKYGIKRAVAAVEDPDRRVAGKGLAMLREAGVEVVTGVCADEAAEIHQGFFTRLCEFRPMVTLKMAVSADGFIAGPQGERVQISGEVSMAYTHKLRATHDAIMVGAGTALNDDPLLTCRLKGLEKHSPIRIVVDTHLRLPLTSQLVRTAREVPLWILTANTVNAKTFEEQGFKIIPVNTGKNGQIDLALAMQKLGELGLTRVLLEGGAALAESFLQGNLIDRVEWVTSPKKLGEGKAIGFHDKFFKSEVLKKISSRYLGEDSMIELGP